MRVMLIYRKVKIFYQAITYELTQLTTLPVVLRWSYLPMTDITCGTRMFYLEQQKTES
jgi:hypothetical protein